MKTKTQRLSGWAQYPSMIGRLARPEQLSQITLNSKQPYIPRGQGRSYGDAALPSEHGIAISSQRLDRLLAFDQQTGILRAESGTTLKTIIDTFLPRGYFPSVVPGTQFVSLGGCVASDIHGKNHHAVGSFSQHTTTFTLMTADGKQHRCCSNTNADYYWHTIGAQGLTGLITDVSIRLQPVGSAYLQVKRKTASHLTELMALLEAANHTSYNVAWLDGFQQGKHLGQGVVMTGEHAPSTLAPPHFPSQHNKTIPPFFPSRLLNRASQQIYNMRYYRKKQTDLMSYQDFFFPLDHLKHWYRLYGRAGFIQYQVVLPRAQAESAIEKILSTLQRKRNWPYLVVLKTLGKANPAPLSFPHAGFTLALDMPFSNTLLQTLTALDDITLHHAGRVYLTKDARLSANNFQAMYPRWHEWLAFKNKIDPNHQFRSHLSDRLGLTHE